jgi:hypothetical protein
LLTSSSFKLKTRLALLGPHYRVLRRLVVFNQKLVGKASLATFKNTKPKISLIGLPKITMGLFSTKTNQTFYHSICFDLLPN